MKDFLEVPAVTGIAKGFYSWFQNCGHLGGVVIFREEHPGSCMMKACWLYTSSMKWVEARTNRGFRLGVLFQAAPFLGACVLWPGAAMLEAAMYESPKAQTLIHKP